jgi:hypothetical protein
MKNKFILLFFLVLISFISCDSFRYAQGIVLDKETKTPLANIDIHNIPSSKYEEILTQTDSIGRFEFSYTTGGIFGGPHEFWIKQDGYQPVKVKYKYDTIPIIVELEKIK